MPFGKRLEFIAADTCQRALDEDAALPGRVYRRKAAFGLFDVILARIEKTRWNSHNPGLSCTPSWWRSASRQRSSSSRDN